MSLANSTGLMEGWLEVQTFVYRDNTYGERTQPCGAPPHIGCEGDRQLAVKLHLCIPVGSVCNSLAAGAGYLLLHQLCVQTAGEDNIKD